MKISIKLILGGLLIVLIPLIAISFFSLVRASNAMDTLEKQQLTSLTKMIIEQINQDFTNQQDLLKTASARDSVIKSISDGISDTGVVKLAHFYLDTRTTIFHDPNVYNIFYISDLEGKVVGDTAKGIHLGKDFSQESYVKSALAGKATIGHIYKDEKTGQPFLTIAGPMIGKGDKILGTLIMGWKLDGLKKKFNDLALGKTGYAFIIDQNGLFVLHPDNQVTMNKKISDLPELANIGKRMAAMENGIGQIKQKGDEKMVVFSPIPQVNWSLGFVISQSEYMAPIQKMRNMIIATIAVSIVMVIMVILIFVRHFITIPINQIVHTLSENAGIVLSGSQQVSEASKFMAEEASTQEASLTDTAAALERMSSMTKMNAANSEQVHQLSRESLNHLQSTSKAMQFLIHSMDETSVASNDVAGIIKTIDAIAFQTNLLALNAAVEAARAGEAGTGFAVVSDEVRNLAMRSAEASQQTQKMIKAIIKKIVSHSDQVKEMDEKYKNVVLSVRKVAQLIVEISAASKEQITGIDQLNKAVMDMERMIQQAAANAEESAATSAEMNGQAEQMQSIVTTFNRFIKGRQASA